MSLARNIAVNTAVRTATSVIEKLLVFVVMAWIARRLGAEALGVYSYAIAYVVFFRLITDWGIYPILIRRLANAEAGARPAVFASTLGFRMASCVVAISAACASAFWTAGSPVLQVAIVITAITLLDTVSDIFAAMLQANLKQTWLGAVEVTTRIYWAAACLLVLFRGGGVLALLAVFASASVLQLALSAAVSTRLLPLGISASAGAWAGLLRESWPLALQSLMSTVYLRVDHLMLLPMMGLAAVGMYSAAAKLAEAWGLAAGIFIAAAYPLLCRFFAAERARFDVIVNFAFRYLLIGTLFVAGATILLRQQILGTVFGEQYLPAATALGLLMIAEIFLVGNMLSQYVLIAAGLERITFLLSLCAAGSNIALNLLWIPRYGIAGAAAASAVSYAAYGLAQMVAPSTRAFSPYLWRHLWRPCLACAAGISASLAAAPGPLASAALFTVTYAAVLVLLRGFTAADIEVARQVIFRRASAPQAEAGVAAPQV